MAVTATRMSWARRLLVLLAFVLMIGGVVLMVAQREELFLAASVAGFALVLTAVPGLAGRQRAAVEGPVARERADAGSASGAGAITAAAQGANGARDRDAAVLGTREWTGNVTVLPRPAGERPAGAEPSQVEEPRPGEVSTSSRQAEPQPRQAAPVAADPTPRPPASAVAAPREPPPARSATAPPQRQAPTPALPHASADVSPRRVAAVGAAAGALLWLLRRVRR